MESLCVCQIEVVTGVWSLLLPLVVNYIEACLSRLIKNKSTHYAVWPISESYILYHWIIINTFYHCLQVTSKMHKNRLCTFRHNQVMLLLSLFEI